MARARPTLRSRAPANSGSKSRIVRVLPAEAAFGIGPRCTTSGGRDAALLAVGRHCRDRVGCGGIVGVLSAAAGDHSGRAGAMDPAAGLRAAADRDDPALPACRHVRSAAIRPDDTAWRAVEQCRCHLCRWRPVPSAAPARRDPATAALVNGDLATGPLSWSGGQYVWIGGQYAERPAPSANWVPGYWQQGPNGWIWVEGRWA